MKSSSLNRRQFLFKISQGVALLPLASAYARGAAVSQLPKWPDVPKPADEGAGQAPENPPLQASTEQSGGPKAASLPPDQRVGFAIVGLGKLALEQILPAIQQSHLCKVTALVSGHLDKAKRVAKEYGVAEKNIYSYETFDQLKNNPEVQVIYIVLPNSMHAEYTLRAAAAGKHVLCEKPMATSAKEARTMVDACKKAKVKLMIAYRQQYEPNNRWIRKLVREKTFGKVKIFEANNSQN